MFNSLNNYYSYKQEQFKKYKLINKKKQQKNIHELKKVCLIVL